MQYLFFITFPPKQFSERTRRRQIACQNPKFLGGHTPNPLPNSSPRPSCSAFGLTPEFYITKRFTETSNGDYFKIFSLSKQSQNAPEHVKLYVKKTKFLGG